MMSAKRPRFNQVTESPGACSISNIFVSRQLSMIPIISALNARSLQWNYGVYLKVTYKNVGGILRWKRFNIASNTRNRNYTLKASGRTRSIWSSIQRDCIMEGPKSVITHSSGCTHDSGRLRPNTLDLLLLSPDQC